MLSMPRKKNPESTRNTRNNATIDASQRQISNKKPQNESTIEGALKTPSAEGSVEPDVVRNILELRRNSKIKGGWTNFEFQNYESLLISRLECKPESL